MLVLLVPFLLNACSSSPSDEELLEAGISEDVSNVLTSSGSALLINGRPIYLRGDMNDFGVSETHRLRRFDSENEIRWCTQAVLRSDWPPYKFKFADQDWSKGSSFGYAEQPGILRFPGEKVLLNPDSDFEELRFEAGQDGIYRFCLIRDGDKFYAGAELVPAQEQKTLDDVAAGAGQTGSE